MAVFERIMSSLHKTVKHANIGRLQGLRDLFSTKQWKSVISGGSILFRKKSSQLYSQYFLGAENHRHQLNLQKTSKCDTP